MPWFRQRVNGSVNDTSPMSYSTLVMKRLYSRCRMACSMPPVYCVTGIHFATSSTENARSANFPVKRRKYQDESTKVSIVSVSRFAGPPHFGHVTLTKPSCLASGDSPCGEKSTSSGSRTGSSSSGTPTSPHVGQWMIGIGAPQ